ncbi:MAG: two-component system, cell cycle response regulator [Solirubrobacteraceae bacterium]|jgi:diguanylate cyclase (GGDEF)-like protein|nr:two-component system, cell cycle response regulator [Solirubrobacteraceae bacterium]
MTGRVLVVEDDPAIRMLTKTVLEGRGYEVHEAADGPSALPTARDVRPDVILLDVGLPGMDGFGVLGLLKDGDDTRDIPVLMVTAWAEPDLIARALDNGAHDYVRKPFDIGELSARVDAAARIKARQDALSHSNERLAEIATVDLLTGIPNRFQMTENLRRQVASSRRSGRGFSLIMLDLDHFKAVNDSYGHKVGDEVLRAVADRLRDRVRGSDILGRWGGEEFIVLAPDTDLGGAGALAEDLRAGLAVCPLELEDGTLAATASFGVAAWDHEGFEDLMARADGALYEAKAAGRDRVRLAAVSVSA